MVAVLAGHVGNAMVFLDWSVEDSLSLAITMTKNGMTKRHQTRKQNRTID